MKFHPALGHITQVLVAVFVLAPIAKAHADSLNITYFTVAESDRDGGRLCCSTSTNYVLSTLGANGLPVLNPGGEGGGAVPLDLLPDNEITWWSPTLNNGGAGGTSDVTQTGTGVVSLPYDNSSFFPPNGTGTNDYGGFQAAILSGTLVAPSAETISFDIGSDDMAFLYLDGTIACDDGGVHGATSVPCTSSTISAGPHTLELFYVDLDPTQAVLDFSLTTEGVTTSPSVTPEPPTLVFLGSGLLALALLAHRKLLLNV